MSECDACGKQENMPYQCGHCGGTFCSEHRLPENHDCPGLNEWDDPEGVFSSGGPSTSGRSTQAREATTSQARSLWRRYFQGNATYVFLGLMWVTFALQVLVGTFVSATLSRDIFVLTISNPEYVWTWFTSVFAHGGFTHIAVNSIGLYFFGPPVERPVGVPDDGEVLWTRYGTGQQADHGGGQHRVAHGHRVREDAGEDQRERRGERQRHQRRDAEVPGDQVVRERHGNDGSPRVRGRRGTGAGIPWPPDLAVYPEDAEGSHVRQFVQDHPDADCEK